MTYQDESTSIIRQITINPGDMAKTVEIMIRQPVQMSGRYAKQMLAVIIRTNSRVGRPTKDEFTSHRENNKIHLRMTSMSC